MEFKGHQEAGQEDEALWPMCPLVSLRWLLLWTSMAWTPSSTRMDSAHHKQGTLDVFVQKDAMDRTNMQNVEDMQLKQVLAIRLRCAKRW